MNYRCLANRSSLTALPPLASNVSTKLLKSIGLVLGTIGALVIGLQICIAMWIILSTLFLISRFSKRVWYFSDWSWVQFLVTIGSALGIPYVVLLLTFEF